MKAVWRAIGGPVLGRYHSLLRRLHDVEVAVDAMILMPVWQFDATKVFNGQRERQRIFDEIVQHFHIVEVIETGTFLGHTTGYFAQLLPDARVRSCEVSPRFHALARLRLQQFANIELHCGDSRTFLEALDRGSAPIENGAITFVYLDAHWDRTDLPLRSELAAVLARRSRIVVMIDDFAVPHDAAYEFDRYGRGNDLTLKTFAPEFERLGLRWFFPVAAAALETGSRRGCVVLAPVGELSSRLEQIRTLQPDT